MSCEGRPTSVTIKDSFFQCITITKCSPKITGCTFIGDVDHYIFILKNNSDIYLTDSDVSYGRVIHAVNNVNINFINSTLSSNVGLISADRSTITVEKSKVIGCHGNESDSKGSCISLSNSCSLYIRDTIIKNSPQSSFMSFLVAAAGSHIVMENCFYTMNAFPVHFVLNQKSDMSISSSHFVDNNSTAELFLVSLGKVYLHGNIFQNNMNYGGPSFTISYSSLHLELCSLIEYSYYDSSSFISAISTNISILSTTFEMMEETAFFPTFLNMKSNPGDTSTYVYIIKCNFTVNGSSIINLKEISEIIIQDTIIHFLYILSLELQSKNLGMSEFLTVNSFRIS